MVYLGKQRSTTYDRIMCSTSNTSTTRFVRYEIEKHTET